MRRRSLPLAAALLTALALPATTHAMRVAMPRPTVCARATLVVIGEVTGTAGRWQAGDQGGIETLVDVAVTRTVYGTAPDALTVVTPGGSVGGLTQTLSESPRLRPDARYLLLLAPGADGWTLVGGIDGAIPLRWGPDGPGEVEADAIASLGSCRG